MKKKPMQISANLDPKSNWAALYFPLPDEKDAYDAARTGMDLRCAITDFYNDSLRRRIKYDNTLSDSAIKLVEEIRSEFIEKLKHYDCDDAI
ncbi:MAG: hypothetical protein IPJ03_16655 [Ignavibacteriales bacterium]|nr:hypothetical protein [Ignavibacteriales bacterium]